MFNRENFEEIEKERNSIPRIKESMENLKQVRQNSKIVFLIFTGDISSFLSACYLIEQGYRVYMVIYDNGCISYLDAVKETADRIIASYGSNNASFLGTKSIAANLYSFQEPFLLSTVGEFSKKYPNLQSGQLPCLACHMGRLVQAIAYCKAHRILCLAEGLQNLDYIFFKLPDMVRRYERLAKKNGIHLILPVYNLTDSWQLKQELLCRGFVSKVILPHCWIECRSQKKLCTNEIDSLLLYYDNVINPRLQNDIDEAEKIFRALPDSAI